MSVGAAPALDLVLFASRPEPVLRARAAGIASFIVDWEWREKEERQRGADTEIGGDSVADLARLETLGAERRFCRLNRFGPWTASEVEDAFAARATDLLLPMVVAIDEVDRFLALVDGRARAGILVETLEAVALARELARRSLDLVYVGLNDLAISRGSASIFAAVADGTVERVRDAFPDAAFGFGGVTVVDGGAPIPCSLLLGEMARLRCSWSFLRRSFKRDIAGRDWRCEIERIGALWQALVARPAAAMEEGRERLREQIECLALTRGVR